MSTTSGKASGLARLKAKGLRVPAFFVVSADLEPEDPLLSTFLAEHDSPAGFAVRSSAQGEDAADSSYAGIFRTFLNVSAEEVAAKVSACREALNNADALAYQAARSETATEMDVIVQKMIHPEVSGVLFTVHPEGLLSETVIQVGAGSGENVVRGETAVTTYYCNTKEGTSYFVQDLESPLLSTEQLTKLLEAAKTVQTEMPHSDLEFSIDEAGIWFLQWRPITGISDSAKIILDNSNISESYPGITLPLSISFAEIAYTSVFTGLARRLLGKRQASSAALAPLLQNMVASWNGHMYYQIQNWYRVLRYLPKSETFIPIWQEMMGVEEREFELTESKLGFWGKRVFTFRLGREMKRLPKNMRKLNRWFQEVEEDFRNRDPLQSKQEVFRNLQAKLMQRWDVTLLNDVYTFLYTGLLRRLLADEESSSAQIAGVSELASLEPIKELAKLVTLAKDLGGVEAFDRAEWLQARTAFLERFGDRAPEELKLETVTFRVDPTLLDDQVGFYLDHEGILAERLQAVKSGETDFKDLSGFKKVLARFYRNRAQEGIHFREQSRLNRTRIYGMVRELMREIGREMVAAKHLVSVEDVFYLMVEEVFQSKDYRATVADRKRQYAIYRDLPTYARVKFAEEIFEKHHAEPTGVSEQNSSGSLKGEPCSNGKVEGEVLVIRNLQDGDLQKRASGKILVTSLTDPGWVYLLVQAKGLITEKGSLLSHTGIISRELHLPAITGVRGATQELRSGDLIRMDGSTGLIERLEKKVTRDD